MFTPNANILKSEGNYLVKCVSNPRDADKKKGIYQVRLTLIKRPTKRGSEIPLKIEFSVPKMIYGNNVEEVEEKDFDTVIKALHKSVQDMGALVSIDDLKKATVSVFHPSKNVILSEGYTSGFIINEINKIDATKKMDLNKDSFRNNGQSIQFYTNSHSLVVYDKIQDLRKPEKRAMDKDQNSIQGSLFDLLIDKKNKAEILRIEVRLAKKVKMNSILNELGYAKNPTFQDIFKKDLCQKVVNNYWNEFIVSKNLFLFDFEENPQKILERVFRNRPKTKGKQSVYLIGLWALSKKGIRGARAVLERHIDGRTWYRMAKDLLFLDQISIKSYHGWVKQIQEQLEDYKPYKINKNELQQ
ncbi:MAG: hypothetical protein FJY91_01075 [Candidatus Harrisonbacteria bacterium]|nr:hypothetical protein [Candidatus Harrisonbacteria bacterium]